MVEGLLLQVFAVDEELRDQLDVIVGVIINVNVDLLFFNLLLQLLLLDGDPIDFLLERLDQLLDHLPQVYGTLVCIVHADLAN